MNTKYLMKERLLREFIQEELRWLSEERQLPVDDKAQNEENLEEIEAAHILTFFGMDPAKFIKEESSELYEEEQSEVDDKGAKKDPDEEDLEEVNPAAVLDLVSIGLGVAAMMR